MAKKIFPIIFLVILLGKISAQTVCTTGIWADTSCLSCTSPTACTSCAAGYMASGGSYPTTSCMSCSAGTYALSGATSCTNCAAGKSSPAGSTTSTACADCAAQQYSTAGGVCTACAAGTYSAAAAGSCTACTTGLGCATCTAANACTTCNSPLILTTSPAGKCCPISCTDCSSTTVCTVCASTYTLASNICKKDCNTGNSADGACTVCPSGGATCTTCAAEYDGSGTAACTICAAGKTSTAGTACANCANGKISVAGQGCTDCPANTYAVGGATSCTACPSGQFSAAAATSCTACSTGCLTCTAAANTACVTCSTGLVVTAGGNCCSLGCTACTNTGTSTITSTCTACAAGYYLNNGACTACATGKISVAGSTVSTACTDCAANTYSIGGVGTCAACPASTYSAAVASTCTNCPAGCATCTAANACGTCVAVGYVMSTPTAGTCIACSTGCNSCSTASACTVCAAGYYLASGACTACAAGKTSSAGSSALASCTNCLQDTYSSSAGSATCPSCTSGTYAAPGSVSCTTCPTGCNTCTYTANGPSCTGSCASGYFLTAASGATPGSCTACSTGCSTCTATTATLCTSCMAGYFYTSATSGTTCTQCAVNFYQGSSGSMATACTACPSGKASNINTLFQYCDDIRTITHTQASLAAAASKVFDGSIGAADVATWGSTYDMAIFGPGAQNTTIYAYALDFSSSSIQKVISRTLNATALNNATADTTMAAKTGEDAVYSTAITTLSSPQAAVGLGSIALAYTALDTATIPCSQVYVTIFNGGTASPIVTKAITSYTCSKCTTGTAGTGMGYTNAVKSVFFENSTYYVAYTSRKFTETMTAGGTGICSTNGPTGTNAITNEQAFAYIQGVNASSTATFTWNASIAIYTGAASTAPATASPSVSSLSIMCGSGNYSTTLFCTMYTGATPSVLQYIPVTVSTGAVGSPVTIATNVAAGTTYPQTTTYYYTAGCVSSIYQVGILIGMQMQSVASATATTTYSNTLMFYNLTSGATATAGGVAIAGYTNSISSGTYTAMGVTYNEGYAILDDYTSVASTTTTLNSDSYGFSGWFANGTAMGTKSTYATGSGYSNSFIDADGALWAGVYSEGASLTTGYLGKVIKLYTVFGNILANCLGVVSLVLASLFAL